MNISPNVETVQLCETFGSLIMTRNAVANLFDSLTHKKNVVLDFKNVEFISRSAAHEYLRKKSFTNLTIKEINMSQNVKAMFLLVAKQLKKITA